MNAPVIPPDDPELLARALARTPDCPPLERLAAAAFEELEPAESARVLEHAAGCAACAVEIELARGFRAEPTDARRNGDAAEVDRIVARLRAATASPVAGSAEATDGRVLRFEKKARPHTGTTAAGTVAWQRWAAAALLVLGVGLFYRGSRDLLPPDPVDPIGPRGGDVVRGGLRLDAPRGEVVGAPHALAWSAHEGAVRYRWEILDVAGDPIAAGETAASSAALDAAQRASLRPRTRYGWRVAALDAAGAELASSETVEFFVRPPAGP